MNKLSFSLLWRILVLHLVYVSLVMLVAVPLFRDNPFMAGKLYMLWWGLGLLLLGFHFLTKRGLLYFLWGWRLNKSEMFWKRLNIGLVVLYVALGLWSILVASLAPLKVWVEFEPVAPLLFYVLFVALAPWFFERVDKKRGMTKIRLIVLVCVRLIVLACVICLVIGFAFLMRMEHVQDIKAKMTEVTNSMSHVASAVAAYHEDENTWPHCDGVIAIRTSLGVSISTDRISSITVTSPRTEEIIITATITGIDLRVDGKNLTLTGKPSECGVLWVWGGTVPSTFVPKK
jgi:intracellular septation protein A